MKPWNQKPPPVKEIEREIPRIQPDFWPVECLYGPHKAEILHRGTAYCRTCYDEKNRLGGLLNP